MFLKSSLLWLTEVRTKEQHKVFKRKRPMLHQIKTAAARSQDTLLADALGAAALMITLVGALYLPGLF
jgi:hypothetical protein